tara:strand:- start:869 stop:1066 length:198 start_codon:yes stop_codon:yes gene_type:complete
MYTFINYFYSFFTVVVLNCMNPINWDNCKDPHVWLFPGIAEGMEIYFNPDSIYQSERDVLNGLDD